MPPEEWGGRFEPTSLDGQPIPVEELPLSIALRGAARARADAHPRRPGGELRDIEVTAFPIDRARRATAARWRSSGSGPS